MGVKGVRFAPDANAEGMPSGLVIDVIDVVHRSLALEEQADLHAQGHRPVTLNQYIRRPIEYLVNRVIGAARTHRSISLLRIHGHGVPGVQMIAGGEIEDDTPTGMGGNVPPKPRGPAGIVVDHLSSYTRALEGSDRVLSVTAVQAHRRDLARLAPYFRPRGEAWPMGCYVGRYQAGRALLQAIARVWRVPVSAGSNVQWGGGHRTFRLEGSVVTMYP